MLVDLSRCPGVTGLAVSDFLWLLGIDEVPKAERLHRLALAGCNVEKAGGMLRTSTPLGRRLEPRSVFSRGTGRSQAWCLRMHAEAALSILAVHTLSSWMSILVPTRVDSVSRVPIGRVLVSTTLLQGRTRAAGHLCAARPRPARSFLRGALRPVGLRVSRLPPCDSERRSVHGVGRCGLTLVEMPLR